MIRGGKRQLESIPLCSDITFELNVYDRRTAVLYLYSSRLVEGAVGAWNDNGAEGKNSVQKLSNHSR